MRKITIVIALFLIGSGVWKCFDNGAAIVALSHLMHRVGVQAPVLAASRMLRAVVGIEVALGSLLLVDPNWRPALITGVLIFGLFGLFHVSVYIAGYHGDCGCYPMSGLFAPKVRLGVPILAALVLSLAIRRKESNGE